jgi:SNF2 family DNA or RNA helicase
MPMQLRPYQQEAVARGVSHGSLLMAMVMGSGKTVTAITTIRQLRRRREAVHGVVLAPKSTLGQWFREIQEWDPRASVQVINGDRGYRHWCWRHAREFNYNIATIDSALIHDWEIFKEHAPRDFMIIDEVTCIKGFTAKRSKRAKMLAKTTPVRLGLSGAPIENRPEEAFSIMEWVDREALGPFERFDRTFIKRDHWGRPKKYVNLATFHKVMDQVMFRRSREDIKEWLPERIEMEVPVVLEPAVMKLHDHVRDDLSSALDQAIGLGASGSFDVVAHYGRGANVERMSAMGQVMSRLLAMRMLSSHPHLLKRSADDFDNPLSKQGSEYASTLNSSGLLDGLPPVTVKLEALVEMVHQILDEDARHKVVVFSYFRPMLRMIEKALARPSVLIDGMTPQRQRDRAIQAFNHDPKTRIFLSSDAGAYGVDLNQGSHLICYDLPWSAGALAQRVARIDRTNSAFDQINISYLYGQGTIEERMYRMLAQKMRVARAFLDGDFDGKTGGIKLDLESLREFLDAA